MKKYIVLFLVSTLLLGSCSKTAKKNPASDYLDEITVDYNKEDTATVNRMTDEFIRLMNAKEYQNAASMLYKVSDGDVKPYTDEDKKKFVDIYTMFPVKDFKKQVVTMNTELHNTIKISVFLEGQDESAPSNMNISLNPVNIDGDWYLTLNEKENE